MNVLDKEQVEYLVSYYNKYNVLQHVTDFKTEEQATSFAESQQKHYTGVKLIVVKRTSKMELV